MVDLVDEVTLAIIEIYDMTEDVGVSRTQSRLMIREAVDLAAEILDEVEAFEAETLVSMNESNALLSKALRRA